MSRDDDLDYLCDLKNRFWSEFSDMCNRYVQEGMDRKPDLKYLPMLRWLDEIESALAETTSFYGRRQS